MGKIKILYLVAGAHLYGDNRSILETIMQTKDKVDIIAGVTSLGPFTKILDREGINYYLVYGSMSPHIHHNYIHYSLSLRLKRLLKYLWNYPRAYFRISSIIKRFRPDIIHTNNSFIYSGAILARRYHIKHIWHIREYIELDHHAEIPDKKFFERNRERSHCIAISKGIFEYFNMRSPKDAQIYNGVFSIDEIKEYTADKKPFFLYLGRLVQTKGCEEMIEGFADFHVQHKQYRLVLAGDGDKEYVDFLKALVSSLGIESNVEFIGFIEDVKNLLYSAKALIVPSYFEAFGRITAEAMMCGCYVIGRGTAGTKELMDNENAGIQFSTVRELSQAMAQVASMTSDEMAKENIRVMKSASQRYSSEENAKQIIEFYKQVIKY